MELTEDTNEKRFWKLCREGTVDDSYKPVEEFFKDSLANCAKGIVDLFDSLTLYNIFGTDFDSWRAQGFSIFSTGDTLFGSTWAPRTV